MYILYNYGNISTNKLDSYTVRINRFPIGEKSMKISIQFFRVYNEETDRHTDRHGWRRCCVIVANSDIKIGDVLADRAV